MLRLVEILSQDNKKIFHFKRVRSDGIELDSLLLTCNGSLQIETIEILGGSEGSCALEITGRLIHCSIWESESSAQESSDWSKHYTSRVGSRAGDKADAQKIIRGFASTLHDTYIKHILHEFTREKLLLTFDEDLYRNYTPPLAKPISAPESPKPEAEQLSAPRKSLVHDYWKFFFDRRLMATSVAAVLASTISICSYLYHRPPELPPKSALILEMEAVMLLPFLDRIHLSLEEILEKYAAGEKYGVLPPSKSTDAQLIPLFKFQTDVIQNAQITTLEKARQLRLLFREKIFPTTPLLAGSANLRIFDILSEQLIAEPIFHYLLYLVHNFAGTEISTEAHFIFSEIAQDQWYIAESLFDDAGISTACAAGNFSYKPHPNETILICQTYGKYRAILGYERATRDSAYYKFQISVLTHANANTPRGHGKNELAYKIKKFQILNAEAPGELLAGIGDLGRISASPIDSKEIWHSEMNRIRKKIRQGDSMLEILRAVEASQISNQKNSRRSNLTDLENAAGSRAMSFLKNQVVAWQYSRFQLRER